MKSPMLEKKKIRSEKDSRPIIYHFLPARQFARYMSERVRISKTSLKDSIPKEYHFRLIKMWIEAVATNLLNGYSFIGKNSEIRLSERVKINSSVIKLYRKTGQAKLIGDKQGPINRRIFIQMIKGKNRMLLSVKAYGNFGRRIYDAIVKDLKTYKTEFVHEKICSDK